MLARIGANGAQKTWNPLKLAHVLETFAPNLGATMNDLSVQALESTPKGQAAKGMAPMRMLLRTLLELLQTKYAAPPGAVQVATDLVQQYEETPYSLETWRQSSRELAAVLLGPLNAVSADELAALRREALEKAAAHDPALSGIAGAKPQRPERFLDCEIIAMYW